MYKVREIYVGICGEDCGTWDGAIRKVLDLKFPGQPIYCKHPPINGDGRDTYTYVRSHKTDNQRDVTVKVEKSEKGNSINISILERIAR